MFAFVRHDGYYLCDIFTLCDHKSSAASNYLRHKIKCVYYVTSSFGRLDLSQTLDFYYVTTTIGDFDLRGIRGFQLRHKNYWTF